MRRNGFSLFEILVVVGIFAILGVIATQSVILTLRGARKSEAVLKVRENLNYSLAVMERQLRNAEKVTPCPNTDTKVINYTSLEGVDTAFSCMEDAPNDDYYIASGSATRLTSDEVKITSCSLACSPGDSQNPPSVTINISAEDKSMQGVEGAKVTASTKIYLRNY